MKAIRKKRIFITIYSIFLLFHESFLFFNYNKILKKSFKIRILKNIWKMIRIFELIFLTKFFRLIFSIIRRTEVPIREMILYIACTTYWDTSQWARPSIWPNLFMIEVENRSWKSSRNETLGFECGQIKIENCLTW